MESGDFLCLCMFDDEFALRRDGLFGREAKLSPNDFLTTFFIIMFFVIFSTKTFLVDFWIAARGARPDRPAARAKVLGQHFSG